MSSSLFCGEFIPNDLYRLYDEKEKKLTSEAFFYGNSDGTRR